MVDSGLVGAIAPYIGDKMVLFLVIVGLGYYIYKKDKEHGLERKVYLDKMEKLIQINSEQNETINTNNELIKENSRLTTEVKDGLKEMVIIFNALMKK